MSLKHSKLGKLKSALPVQMINVPKITQKIYLRVPFTNAHSVAAL